MHRGKVSRGSCMMELNKKRVEDVGVGDKYREDEMTPINRAGAWKAISLRCNQHDKAMMLGKYFAIYSFKYRSAGWNNHDETPLPRRKIKGPNNMQYHQKTILHCSFAVGKIAFDTDYCSCTWQQKHNWFHFQLPIPLNPKALTRSSVHSLFMYLCIYLFTLPRDLWWMRGCHVCRIHIC